MGYKYEVAYWRNDDREHYAYDIVLTTNNVWKMLRFVWKSRSKAGAVRVILR